jgi:hypothetical protein
MVFMNIRITIRWIFLILAGHTIAHAVARQSCPVEQVSAPRREMTMHTHEQTTVWGTHIGSGRGRKTRSWYQQLRDWWTAHKATRHQANIEALNRCWDATRETVTSQCAEAAPDMAAAHHAISAATMLYGLSS